MYEVCVCVCVLPSLNHSARGEIVFVHAARLFQYKGHVHAEPAIYYVSVYRKLLYYSISSRHHGTFVRQNSLWRLTDVETLASLA